MTLCFGGWGGKASGCGWTDKCFNMKRGGGFNLDFFLRSCQDINTIFSLLLLPCGTRMGSKQHMTSLHSQSGIGLQCNHRPTVMRQMAIAPDRVHVNIWRLEHWSDSRERKCVTNDILLQKVFLLITCTILYFYWTLWSDGSKYYYIFF